MVVKDIKSLAEFKSIVNTRNPLIVNFWAEWCEPAKEISPTFELLSDQPHYSTVVFYKVDVEAVQEISMEVGIRAMPTFILFRDGESIGRLHGSYVEGLVDGLEKLVKGESVDAGIVRV